MSNTKHNTLVLHGPVIGRLCMKENKDALVSDSALSRPDRKVMTHEERLRLIYAPWPTFTEHTRRYTNARGRRKPASDWQPIHTNDTEDDR